MRGLITICARGGSKGIPGKNIKSLGGRPLIYYSLKTAQDFSKENSVDIFLSTDSEEIREVVDQLNVAGVNTSYKRPEKLATDQAGKLVVIEDVKLFAEGVNKCQYDYVIDLDVTSPLRTVGDLKTAKEMLFENSEAVNIFSVSPANRNPYFNMVEQLPTGFYGLCKKGEYLTRQSAPKVYDLNASFYIFKSAFFKNSYQTVITDNSSLVYEVPHLCFDLDHPIDFEFMSYLLERNKLDFTL